MSRRPDFRVCTAVPKYNGPEETGEVMWINIGAAWHGKNGISIQIHSIPLDLLSNPPSSVGLMLFPTDKEPYE